jgi:YesN/AraC family two-component response regulator
MVTAVDPDFDIIEMPFDDYVIKPVSRDDLFETIQRLLACSEYEQKLRRYYALTAKHATLLANKPESELQQSEQFEQLEAEMADVRDGLDDTISEFDDDDFAAAFRDLDHEPGPPTE